MAQSSSSAVQKFSAVPIAVEVGKEFKLPFSVTSDVAVESLEGRIKGGDFALWENYVSKDSLDVFVKMEHALVHRFVSSSGTGDKEQASKDLLHKVFVCLRLIRPTRAVFSVAQFRILDDKLDVFSFMESKDPLTLVFPESEVLNQLSQKDLYRLRDLLPTFLSIERRKDTRRLQRAIRYFEGGYADVNDLALQLIVWMMGIEALFSEDGYDFPAIKKQINETVGSKTDIYEEFTDRDLYGAEPVLVGDVLDDLFRLRNSFVHGGWAPTEWINRGMRSSIGGGSINYADVLREAASFILRRSILASVERSH